MVKVRIILARHHGLRALRGKATSLSAQAAKHCPSRAELGFCLLHDVVGLNQSKRSKTKNHPIGWFLFWLPLLGSNQRHHD